MHDGLGMAHVGREHSRSDQIYIEILLHLSSPCTQFSITFQLLQCESGRHFWRHNKYETPWPSFRAETSRPCTTFEPSLNTSETRDSNRVFTTDRDLNTGEDFVRVVDDRTNGRKVGS